MNQRSALLHSAGAAAFAQRFTAMCPWHRHFDSAVIAIDPNEVRLTLIAEPHLVNDRGAIHQSAVCAAADLAGSILAELSVPDGRAWVTTGLSLAYGADWTPGASLVITARTTADGEWSGGPVSADVTCTAATEEATPVEFARGTLTVDVR